MARTSFDLYDYFQTVNTFGAVFGAEKAELDDLLMRRRKAELLALLHKVIQNELCAADRRLIQLHWFQGKSAEALAKELEIDRSSVYRRIERITNTLYEKMKYALSYRYDGDFSSAAALLLERKTQNELCTQQGGNNALQKWRKRLVLTPAQLGAILGMPAARIVELEKDRNAMTVGELQQFLRFFGVSAESFLFGDAERG